MDDFAVDVGQAHVAAAEAVGESLVIDAQEVQDRGVEVVDLDLVLDGVVAVVVGGAVDGAAFDPAAGQPDGEAVGVVVAAVGSLRHRGAAEFAAPDDQGRVEQAARLEVLEQAGDRLVDGAGVVLVAVPSDSPCWSQRSPPTSGQSSSTKRTPRSTRRRASRQWRPKIWVGA